MPDKVISASEFKARCLALLDRVAETGERVVVTKHGRAVAQLAPLDGEDTGAKRSLEGSVTFLVSDKELIAALKEPWDAEQGILVRE